MIAAALSLGPAYPRVAGTLSEAVGPLQPPGEHLGTPPGDTEAPWSAPGSPAFGGCGQLHANLLWVTCVRGPQPGSLLVPHPRCSEATVRQPVGRWLGGAEGVCPWWEVSGAWGRVG